MELVANMKRHLAKEDGATAVEYAILVALIAVAVIGVLLVFGPKIAATFQKANDALPALITLQGFLPFL